MLSLFASYFVAMTVVPLFCAKLIKAPHLVHEHQESNSGFGRYRCRIQPVFRETRCARLRPHSLHVRRFARSVTTSWGWLAVAAY